MSRCKSAEEIRKFKGKACGSVVETSYRLSRDGNGNSIYTSVGEQNIKEYINSFKNGCSLQAMLERIQYMPVHEKIAYMNQTEDGYSADLTYMPSDGTEAFIMLEKLKREHPDLVKSINEGATFDEALKAVYGKKTPSEGQETQKGEEVDNGTN